MWGHLVRMIARHVVRFLGPAVAAAWGLSASVLVGPVLPATSAQGCPDVEVVFARGTGDPPGVGPTGQAFVDALRSRVGGRSFEVYPVNYPATEQWTPASTVLETPARMWCPRPTAVPTPRWC